MRKKLLLIFLVVVAILFVTINIRDSMQRPFHRERVNNFITVAKDLKRVLRRELELQLSA